MEIVLFLVGLVFLWLPFMAWLVYSLICLFKKDSIESEDNKNGNL